MYFFFQFPQQIFQVSGNLRTLDLSNNKLKTIPNTIGQFTSLKSLSLSEAKLSK